MTLAEVGREVEVRALDGGYDYAGLLARVKKALETSKEVAVPVADIRRFPGQPRTHFDEEALARLSESIDASGQTTSGIIRENPGPTRYELIDGERRWRAVQMIPQSRRPLYRARLIIADDAVVQYLISGIANFNRANHTALETSDAVCRLARIGLPQREIAALLGLSVPWVVDMYALRNLEPKARALLDPKLPRRQQLPVTAAIEISKTAKRLQLDLARRVISRDVQMSNLRAEVVRVSHKAKVEVRTNVVSPRRKWDRLKPQLAAIDSSVRAVDVLLEDPAMLAYFKNRSRYDLEERARALRLIEERAAHARTALEKLLQS